MAYTPYNQAQPTTAQTRQAGVDAMRTNMVALRDILAAGGLVPGFDYSASGGSAEQPAQIFFKRGAEWIRIDLAWGSSGGADGNVTKAAYYYSANSGGLYDPMADAAGEYVAHLSYDANGNLTTLTWDATP